MKLRARLALTTLGVALPLVGALVLGLRSVVQRASDDLVAAAVLARVGPELRGDCERGATTRLSLTLPRHAGARLFGRNPTETVNVELVSRAGSPGVPEPLVSSIARGEPVAARTANGERQLLVALPWEAGPCAAAFARARPAQPPLLAPPVVIPILLALVAILVGLGPIVRRILSLTDAVRRFRSDTAQVPPPATERDELGELSRAFHDAAQSVHDQHAELAMREHDLREFVENTSHDLATPLTVLQGHLSALERGHDPRVVRQAMNEAHYLGSLLGSLALTAKLDAGARLEVTLDLDELVTRVVDRHRGLAARNAVTLECATGEDAVLVAADPTCAEQALTNLVGNAVRHNREGGHVAVVLDASEGEFVLRVLDDGPGLSPGERERVLSRGERGDRARTRGTQGQGLGLAIASRVAAAQGWELTLEANQPSGLIAELRGRRQPGRTAGATGT